MGLGALPSKSRTVNPFVRGDACAAGMRGEDKYGLEGRAGTYRVTVVAPGVDFGQTSPTLTIRINQEKLDV